MNKQQISKQLQANGSSWAVTTTKTHQGEYGKAYGVHPTSARPHEQDMLKFYSLREIAEWLKVVKHVKAMSDQDRAAEMMQDFWIALDTERASK